MGIGPYGFGSRRSPGFFFLRLALFVVFAIALILSRNNSSDANSVRAVYYSFVGILILGGLLYTMRRRWNGGFSDKRARTVETPHHTPTVSGAPVQYHAPAPAPASEPSPAPIVPPPSSTPGLTWGGQSAPDLGTSSPTE